MQGHTLRYQREKLSTQGKKQQCNSLNVSRLDFTRGEWLFYRSCLLGSDAAFSSICERPCRWCPAVLTRGAPYIPSWLQLGDLLLHPHLFLLLFPAFSSSDSYVGDHTSRRRSRPVCAILPYTCCRIFAGATVCFSFNTLHLPGLSEAGAGALARKERQRPAGHLDPSGSLLRLVRQPETSAEAV